MMTLLRNLLALIGLLALLVGGYLYYRGIALMHDIDPQAPQLMARLAQQSRQGPLVTAFVKRIAVSPGVDATQAVAAAKRRAATRGLQLTADWAPAATSGTEAGRVHVLEFWEPETASPMLRHNAAFSAFLPARIAVVKDAQGKLWMVTPDLGLLVHGGPTPDPELQQQASHLQALLTDIMQAGARGQP